MEAKFIIDEFCTRYGNFKKTSNSKSTKGVFEKICTSLFYKYQGFAEESDLDISAFKSWITRNLKKRRGIKRKDAELKQVADEKMYAEYMHTKSTPEWADDKLDQPLTLSNH
ncbi:hypothetical protein A3J61_00215 [Candidatus Nomurabacteria bacterium RIFCSPHIGHO2_02_FULL_38_15]|uniref:Uncharacterized protein n=1 Tax=Candidatus Nomurabacteria bacterium RIFCSPHIGHO2_02_FULL_38_15 TaxID=1801752 RepID=A0A1F6VS09_9BACT|nr:MAG: hypothetical protein A3J61_00215 [Candidatus Nomurabacteria bacterium RIFCSPHIGHO2_02_FULL_38_15]